MLRAVDLPKLACLAAITAAMLGFGQAQAQQSPVCARLEASLAALEQQNTRAASPQGRGYEKAISRQQVELDRTIAHARNVGCDGFFLFGGRPPECDGLNGQINRMKANLDRMNREYNGIGGGQTGDLEAKRRQLLAALADGNCGPQYRPQQAARPRSLLEQLFGVGAPTNETSPNAEVNEMPQISGSYRTVCVRSCDGGFFPISFSAGRGRFATDEKICQSLCPAQQVELYAYHTTGEGIEQAFSIDGRPYSALPNALKFRQEYNPACSCKRPDQTWAEALSHIQDQGERGDIIVTEEQAKELSQPASKLATELKQGSRAGKSAKRAKKPKPEAAIDAADTNIPVGFAASARPAGRLRGPQSGF